MADLMRNHLQMQGQQAQQAHQQPPQQFGLPHNQMNGGMHDLQAQQLMQNQLQGGNIGALGGFGNSHQAVLQAMQQRGLMGMLQGGNPEVNRQFDLLNASHQTGMAGHPSNMQIAAARMRQQAAMNQLGQNNMFGPPGGDAGGAGPMPGPSAPGGLPGALNGQVSGSGPGGFPTLEELRNHAHRIKTTIMAMDTEIQALTNSPGMKTEADQQRINELRVEKQRRVPVLKKVIHAISEMQRAGVNTLTSNILPGGGGGLGP